MITDNPIKQDALRLGETAGEEHALALYAKSGIDALAATLRPRDFEGYKEAFDELWDGGDEGWLEHALENRLAGQHGVHPHYYKAFDEVFARGARRCAEMLVRGYLDARAGVPIGAPIETNAVTALRGQIETLERRMRLGDRPHLLSAYDTGYRLYLSKAAEEGSHG
jgi:hypothetical protein